MGFEKDKNKIYSSFDVLVVTSYSEGMPNNVLEALAMGLSVVCYPVGGISEINHPRLIKVDDYSLESYVSALIKIFKKKITPLPHVKQFSEWESINRYWNEITTYAEKKR